MVATIDIEKQYNRDLMKTDEYTYILSIAVKIGNNVTVFHNAPSSPADIMWTEWLFDVSPCTMLAGTQARTQKL